MPFPFDHLATLKPSERTDNMSIEHLSASEEKIAGNNLIPRARDAFLYFYVFIPCKSIVSPVFYNICRRTKRINIFAAACFFLGNSNIFFYFL